MCLKIKAVEFNSRVTPVYLSITSDSAGVRAAPCEAGEPKKPCLRIPDSLCSLHACSKGGEKKGFYYKALMVRYMY